ncbi:ABC transporter ATP-binding protein [Prosthecomicrobium hirschii]|uniref:ABC transporter ATP-binding protein n=1 Tax=Prosthecodimorpha hirschii TaxID=665126 RepID=UPI0022203413|nr:ABC transporter ATP-binding protein [Prosthecomicrobium hirschii]MCW1841251.1 ABC transporter ATP-binding protein [Prosthecomicrobium hirschii]
MARIELNRLAHSYKAHPSKPSDFALKEMTHTWEHGGAYALLGPSGCGKTTLLNIISGLVTPSQGVVLFDGRDVTRLPTEKRNIAQVFQFPVIYDTMTVAQNLAFPLKNRGVDRATIDRRIAEVSRMLGLEREMNRPARGLTADMKQKISLGRGLVRADVGAILFDEPLTVIDPHMKWLLRAQLKRVHEESDVTMIYVTHDQTEALTFADKVVVMYDGEVVQLGTPQELFERPEHTFVGYFIGSPGMNVLPARIEGDRAHVGAAAIPLGAGYAPLGAAVKSEIGIRPEFLRLAAGTDGFPVALKRVEDIGRHKILRCELDGRPLAAIAAEAAEIPADGIRLSADPAHVHVYADGHRVPAAGRA